MNQGDSPARTISQVLRQASNETDGHRSHNPWLAHLNPRLWRTEDRSRQQTLRKAPQMGDKQINCGNPHHPAGLLTGFFVEKQSAIGRL